ncbi:SRPBCC family protein [Nocardia sp. Marseille-Q1738]
MDIGAPAEVVWQVLTDFERYGEWNQLCVEMVQRKETRSHTPGAEFSHTMKPAPMGAPHSLRSHTVTPHPYP